MNLMTKLIRCERLQAPSRLGAKRAFGPLRRMEPLSNDAMVCCALLGLV